MDLITIIIITLSLAVNLIYLLVDWSEDVGFLYIKGYAFEYSHIIIVLLIFFASLDVFIAAVQTNHAIKIFLFVLIAMPLFKIFELK